MSALITTFQGRLFFSPKLLPNSGNGTPLSIAQFLTIDSTPENPSISVINVLGAPTDLKPGTYEISCEPRPKSGGKSGISFWYQGCRAVQGKSDNG